MSRSMKRLLPWALAVAGIAVILLVLPVFQPAQPRGISITRGEARQLADRGAREVGIDPSRTWSTLNWWPSQILVRELRNHPRRAEAWNDPVLGPRLNAYRVMYYDFVRDKNPPDGLVYVGGLTGQVTAARRLLRPEKPGANATEAQLRPRPVAAVRVRASGRRPRPHRLGLPLPRGDGVPAAEHRSVSQRLLRRKPARRMAAHRGVRRRPSVRTGERRRARQHAAAVRAAVHPAAGAAHHLPAQVPRRRSRRR